MSRRTRSRPACPSELEGVAVPFGNNTAVLVTSRAGSEGSGTEGGRGVCAETALRGGPGVPGTLSLATPRLSARGGGQCSW